ncbi:MAG: cyclic peptide export ABC transporter [Marinifilaceae bacterium]
MNMKYCLYTFIAIIFFSISGESLFANDISKPSSFVKVCDKIESLFDRAGIPGLSFVLVSENEVQIKNWGYADLENHIPVTSKTLFELGSTSKAFTALAILQMEKSGRIELNDYMSQYLPWLKMFFDGEEVQITIKDLLHHTSGIPKETISKIPKGEGEGMLDRTIRKFNGLQLKSFPGTRYEYATINYDILGLIIERITQVSFEEYLQKNIFAPLDLKNSSVGKPLKKAISKGYKVSFFSPRPYNAPRYRGNNPAGYVISNGEDIAQWLRYQLYLDGNCFEDIIKKSHIPDMRIIPHGHSSYAYGWNVRPYGNSIIFHDGFNPNFSSFIGFIPNKKVGVALLANSNSAYTAYLGNIIIKMLNNEEINEIAEAENGLDKIFTLISAVLIIFILVVFTLLVWVFWGIFKGKRKVVSVNLNSVVEICGAFLLTLPFFYGVYVLPEAMLDFSWEAAVVWGPNSFLTGCGLFLVAVLGVWILSAISKLIPSKNRYFRSLPLIIILSIMSGVANMVIILILINSIGNETSITHLLYYFALSLIFYISSRKFVQTKLINISLWIVYDLRMKLMHKIFSSSYQKFEKIDNGRVYATLNQDTAMISNSVNVLIGLISNFITIVGVFVYLGTISLVATMLILLVIACVAILYFAVSKRTRILFEQARNTANVYSGLIDGLLYGFKELSLSVLKKKEYTKEIDNSCSELRIKSRFALIKFVNAFLVGETLLIMVLGMVSFVIPFLFPEIPNYKLLGIVMIVLYLIGPINGVLNSIPTIMQIKVAWRRINGFIDDIKPDLNIVDFFKSNTNDVCVKRVALKDVEFEYKNDGEDNNFRVGPINLTVNQGEILFVIGGNGSGKTSLANLLTGLYVPDEGVIEVNGCKCNGNEIGQLYSAIFSNNHLFKQMYGVDIKDKSEEVDYLLELLRLKDKVWMEGNVFSTIDLSNGQRKRLSLMKCFLEDSKIYLFDEWAADQDPEYKRIFYRQILPEMKKQGKIVIAITHDDNYFDVADRIIKMNNGKMKELVQHDITKGDEFVYG